METNVTAGSINGNRQYARQIDGTAGAEYYSHAMKLPIFKYSAASLLLAGIIIPASADDLDAALEAQKKKVQRQIYSESAQLDDQNLTVPRTQTEEERLLDRKLREIEARASVTVSPQTQSGAFIPQRDPVAPSGNQNWLTPAVLDEAAAMSLTGSTKEDWLARELDRQKEIKSQESLKKENQLVEKLLKEQSPMRASSPETERLKQYQLTRPDFDSSGPSSGSAYISPQTGRPDPMAAVRPVPKKEPPSAPALFSPEAARISSSSKPVSSSLISPIQNPAASEFSAGRNSSEPVQLTPLQIIKKSAPINKANPFADDHMPQIKSSIWD